MRVLLLLAAVVAASCSSPSATSAPTTKASATVNFVVTSSAFQDGAPIPTDYTCDAGNKQLPIAWSGTPSGTAELALTMDDPDAGGFVHWVVAGIPATATAID